MPGENCTIDFSLLSEFVYTRKIVLFLQRKLVLLLYDDFSGILKVTAILIQLFFKWSLTVMS